MEELEFSQNLQVRYEPDVLVIGGGPAGIAAAVMCARQSIQRSGKTRPSVMLLEQSGCLGGASVLSMVAEIMNFDDGEHFLSGGFGREVHDTLFGECKYEREWYNVRPEPLKRLYDRLVTEASVKLLLYTRVVSAVCEGEGNVKYAIVSGPEGMYAIRASYYIDCSGSASFCNSAGAASDYGDDDGIAMSATLCSQWCGVDFGKLRDQGAHLKQAYDDGLLSQFDTVLPGIKRMYPELGVGGGNIGHCFAVNDCSADSLTEATLNGRKILREYEAYYRKYVPGCENVSLIQTATHLGIRESRRVKCEFTLTFDRFDNPNPFEDEIGRYSYPIDIHPMTADPKGMQDFRQSVSKRHQRGGYYSIPYRSLIPKGFVNLLTAGRCIGADHEMIASLRVIPCCYNTGLAAGIAAAICVEQSCGVREIAYGELRKRLLAAGAYIT